MNRRELLRSIALSGLALTISPSRLLAVSKQSGKSTTGGSFDLVAVLGGEPEVMFRKAITEMGGMSRYIPKGAKVVVKPNIGWDRTPEMGSNTNPKLVGEIVKQVLEAGAKEVVVFDHTCHNWRECYENSGIQQAAQAAGAKVVPANEESYYIDVKLPKGVKLKETKIHKSLVDADIWINVPVLKMHGGAKLTIGMKNYMGIVWDRGYFHKNDLQQCIADIATYHKKPVLTIVDGYRVMTANGPQGKSTADVVIAKGLFISTDMVAVDTAAAKFYNQLNSNPVNLADASHISKAAAMKIGRSDLENLKIKRIKI